MEQHFVEFASPGTFMSESTVKPIDSWDVDKACEMARGIKERYGATPFGFRFTTRSRADTDLDSTITATSCMYYLGGNIETYMEIALRNDPDEETLRWNMRINNWNRVVVNTNSYKATLPLKDTDIVLDWKP